MTDKVCGRCGTCCKYLPRNIKGMGFEYLNYLIQSGITIDGDWALIPHECQHLCIESVGDEGTEYVDYEQYACEIYDKPERSSLCRKFHGQKRGKGVVFWVPKGCTMRE